MPPITGVAPSVHRIANLRDQQQPARSAAGIVFAPASRCGIILDQMGSGRLPRLAASNLRQFPVVADDGLCHGYFASHTMIFSAIAMPRFEILIGQALGRQILPNTFDERFSPFVLASGFLIGEARMCAVVGHQSVVHRPSERARPLLSRPNAQDGGRTSCASRHDSQCRRRARTALIWQHAGSRSSTGTRHPPSNRSASRLQPRPVTSLRAATPLPPSPGSQHRYPVAFDRFPIGRPQELKTVPFGLRIRHNGRHGI